MENSMHEKEFIEKLSKDNKKLINNLKFRYKKNFTFFYDKLVIDKFREDFPEKVKEYEQISLKKEPWLKYQRHNLQQRINRMIFPSVLEKREGVSRKGIGAHLVHLSYSENHERRIFDYGDTFMPNPDINFGEHYTLSEISANRQSNIPLESDKYYQIDKDIFSREIECISREQSLSIWSSLYDYGILNENNVIVSNANIYNDSIAVIIDPELSVFARDIMITIEKHRLPIYDPSLIDNPHYEDCLDRLKRSDDKIHSYNLENEIILLYKKGMDLTELEQSFSRYDINYTMIKKFIQRVDDYEIICMFFGLRGYEQRTQEDIASIFKVTQPAVVKRVNKIKSKLANIYKRLELEVRGQGAEDEDN